MLNFVPGFWTFPCGKRICHKFLACFLVTTFLTGCATLCEPVTVNMPVRVSCVVEVPVKPLSVISFLPSDASDFDKIKALSIDYLSQAQYINQLEAVMEGCK